MRDLYRAFQLINLILIIGIVGAQRRYEPDDPLDSQGRGVGARMAFRGTIRDYSPFNAQDDANKLYKAMKGIGTDEKTVIDIMTKRSNKQRQEIAKIYQNLYGQSLKEAIKGDFSGTTEDILVALLYSPDEYHAKLLNQALKGAGTDLSELTETLCSLTPQEIEKVKIAYQKHYKKDLAKTIEGDTSGPVKTLLLNYIKGQNVGPRSRQEIDTDAKLLETKGFQNIDGRDGVAEIFTTRSHEDLKKIFAKYKQNSNKDIVSAINSERVFKLSQAGKLKKVLQHLVQCINNPPEYYAKRVRDSLKGSGTRNQKLIRLMVSRSEIDLEDIKEAYQRLFGKTMKNAIDTDVTRKFEKVLDGIIDGNVKLYKTHQNLNRKLSIIP